MEYKTYRYYICPCGFTFMHGSPQRSGTCIVIRVEQMPQPLYGKLYTIRDIYNNRIYQVSEFELELEELKEEEEEKE